jgi:hypothetical protein
MQHPGKEETGISKRQYLAEFDEELLCADGFDDAILGICQRACSSDVVAYDRDRCIEIIIERSRPSELTDEEAYEEAVEYFEFNVVGAWSGENTPVFIDLTKR